MGKPCPNCNRSLRSIGIQWTKGMVGALVVTHALDFTDLSQCCGEPPHQCVRQEHIPEGEIPAASDIPGLYPVAVLATTTTTRPPVPTAEITITTPPPMPSPGYIVAWDTVGQTWMEIPDCGFRP